MKNFFRVFSAASPFLYLMTIGVMYVYGSDISEIMSAVIVGALTVGVYYITVSLVNKSKIEKLRGYGADNSVGSSLPVTEDPLENSYQNVIRSLFLKYQMLLSKMERLTEEYTEYYADWERRIQAPLSALRREFNELGLPPDDALWESLRSLEIYVETALCYMEIKNGKISPVLSNQSLDRTLERVVERFRDKLENAGVSLDYKPLGIFVKTDERLLNLAVEEILTVALDRISGGSAEITARVGDEVTLIIRFIEPLGKRDLKFVFLSGLKPVQANSRAEGNELNLCREIFKALEYKTEVDPVDGTTEIRINMGYPSAKVNLWKPKQERRLQ